MKIIPLATSSSSDSNSPRCKRRRLEIVRLASGILLVIAGTIWILQGFDVAFAPESFMTGDRSWVIWGAVTTVAGLTFVWLDRKRSDDR